MCVCVCVCVCVFFFFFFLLDRLRVKQNIISMYVGIALLMTTRNQSSSSRHISDFSNLLLTHRIFTSKGQRQIRDRLARQYIAPHLLGYVEQCPARFSRVDLVLKHHLAFSSLILNSCLSPAVVPAVNCRLTFN